MLIPYLGNVNLGCSPILTGSPAIIENLIGGGGPNKSRGSEISLKE